MTRALDLAARNDLHASLPCGDPDRSAAPHGPAVCLRRTAGLDPLRWWWHGPC